MKSFLITGAAGSLGHTLANLMIQDNDRVIGLILPFEKEDLLDPRVTIMKGDVLDKDSLRKAFDLLGPHGTVIHCAGMISIDPKVSSRIYQVNVQGTKNIVDLSLEYQVDQMIYVSSVHAIPELKKGIIIKETQTISPDKVEGHYSKSKATATRYVMDKMALGFPATIVYPSGIISDEDVKNAFMTQMVKDYLAKTMRVSINGGYDFVDVRDVALGIMAIIQKNIINEHYILSNKYYSVKTMMDILYELTGLVKINLSIPLSLVRIVLPIKLASDKARNKISLYTSDSLKILNSNSIFSHQKAEKELNYHPRDIKETFGLLVKRLSVPQNPLI